MALLWITLTVLAGLAVLLAEPHTGPTLATLGASAVAAAAFVVGAYLAPAGWQPNFPLFHPRSAAWQRTKALQLGGGAVVVLILALVFRQNAGLAAIGGISAALAIGAICTPAGGRPDAEDADAGH